MKKAAKESQPNNNGVMIKKIKLPKLQDIEKLVAYLPKLYAKDFVPIVKWNGLTKEEGGALTTT